MILHENCLPAEDSHVISPYWLFLKKRQNFKLSSAAVVIGALRIKMPILTLNALIITNGLRVIT